MTFVVALAWLAAAIRISVSLRREAEVWRTAFTVGVVAVAGAITVYTYKHHVDELFSAWNFGDLLGHSLLVVAGGAAQVYLLHLRDLRSRPRSTLAWWCGGTASAVAGLAVSWSLAPLHDRPYDDLVPLAGDGWVVLYYVGFWTFMMWCEVCIAFWCLKHGLRLRSDDFSQPLGLLLIGLAALAGVVLSISYSGAMLAAHVGAPAPVLTRIGDLVLPVAPCLLALAILCLAVLPRVGTISTAMLRWRWIGPLWTDLVHRYPEVHLPMISPRSPLAQVQVRETRAIVEIRDALSLAAVAVPPSPTLQQVAVALRGRHDGPRVASDVLPRAITPEEDVQQLLELAKEYARAA